MVLLIIVSRVCNYLRNPHDIKRLSVFLSLFIYRHNFSKLDENFCLLYKKKKKPMKFCFRMNNEKFAIQAEIPMTFRIKCSSDVGDCGQEFVIF